MTERLAVTDINYCESTRNVDNMLNQFESDREYVVKLLNKNPDNLIQTLWTYKSPVSYDEKCIFNMGESAKEKSLDDRIDRDTIENEGMINYYLCPQCRNMRRIFDMAKMNIGEPFYIECGDSAGEQLVITQSNISKLYLINESPPKSVQRALENPNIMTGFLECSAGCNHNTCSVKNYKDMIYVGSDSYTNNLLINWYIQSYLTNLNIPNVINMKIGFVCGSKGYCLYEHPDIGRTRHLQKYPKYLEHDGHPSPTAKEDDKVPISRDTVKGIIMQLFATFHALRPYDFSHGGPSSRTILLKDETCSYLYDGVHVEGPLTIKICDFHHAGITINGHRWYNKSVIADEELLKKPFRPIVESATTNEFSFDSPGREQNITIYRLHDPNKDLSAALLFMYVKHLGLPIYQASFDVYGFMVSLLADRSIYTTVMNDQSMYELWRRMWLPDEFDIIQQKMRNLHQRPDPMTRVDKVLRTLAGFGLRCDMIDYGWNMIKRW